MSGARWQGGATPDVDGESRGGLRKVRQRGDKGVVAGGLVGSTPVGTVAGAATARMVTA
jgi:hypothetical protein